MIRLLYSSRNFKPKKQQHVMYKYHVYPEKPIGSFVFGLDDIIIWHGEGTTIETESEARELADLIASYLNAKASGKPARLVTGCLQYAAGACLCATDCNGERPKNQVIDLMNDDGDASDFLAQSDIEQQCGGYAENET